MKHRIIQYQQNDLNNLEAKLNLKFTDQNKLVIALSHPSVNSLRNKNEEKFLHYERYEFLGDSVLNFIITEILFNKFDSQQEGRLSKIRTTLVCKETLAEIAKSINLGEFLYLSPGEEKTGGKQNPNNLENALEAVIAAIYLDQGMDGAKSVIEHLWQDLLENIDMEYSDPKSYVQEWAQKNNKHLPTYILIEESGSSHNPVFTAAIQVLGEQECRGSGTTKKMAEKKAAQNFLQELKANNRL